MIDGRSKSGLPPRKAGQRGALAASLGPASTNGAIRPNRYTLPRVYRQTHIRGVSTRAVHALCRNPKIALHGLIDVRRERLWVTVDQREPATLDLHHDSMPRLERVIA